MKSTTACLRVLLLATTSMAAKNQELLLTADMIVHRHHGVDDGGSYPDLVVGQGIYWHEIYLTLRNVSKARIVIPKAAADVSLAELDESGRFEVTLGMAWDIAIVNGAAIDVPSEAELKLVSLDVGESTRIRIRLRYDRQLERDSLRFDYFVSQRIAQRFHTWSGASTGSLIAR